jgi:predicted ester cyclase
VTVEEKKAISRRAIEEIYGKRDVEAAQDIYTSDYVLHGPVTDPALRSLEGVQRYVKASREVFQEVDISVEDQIVEGDKVVTRWKARVIPQTGAAGVHLTDYPVTGTGILIDRISDGNIQESWSEERLSGIQGSAEMVIGTELRRRARVGELLNCLRLPALIPSEDRHHVHQGHGWALAVEVGLV